MLRCLSLGVLAATLSIAALPLKAQDAPSEQTIILIQCSGKKTQGSGVATGFPLNHPILVQYKLDQIALNLVEIDIDSRELTAGNEPLPVVMHGNNLIAKFKNRFLQKDYEIQISGDDRLFSITIFPSSRFDPDVWYGKCINIE